MRRRGRSIGARARESGLAQCSLAGSSPSSTGGKADDTPAAKKESSGSEDIDMKIEGADGKTTEVEFKSDVVKVDVQHSTSAELAQDNEEFDLVLNHESEYDI